MENHLKSSIRFRRHLWSAFALVLLVGAGAAVFAGVPPSFEDGETLTAQKLNSSFLALEQRITALESLLSPGAIVAFGGSVSEAADGGPPSAPPGWLLCDGSAVSRSTYAALFAAIGINFGLGDGINTFNLPDLRGRFLRGADRGAGRDPDIASRAPSSQGAPSGDVVGSTQEDELRTHRHQQQGSNRLDVANGGAIHVDDVDNNSFAPIYTQYVGGKETRPKNIAVNYLIKY